MNQNYPQSLCFCKAPDISLGAPVGCCSGVFKTVPQKLSCVFDFWGMALLWVCALLRKSLFLLGSEEHLFVTSAWENEDRQRGQQPKGLTWEWWKAQLQSNRQCLAKPGVGKQRFPKTVDEKDPVWCLLLEWPHKQKPRPGANSLTQEVDICDRLIWGQSKKVLTETEILSYFESTATTSCSAL